MNFAPLLAGESVLKFEVLPSLRVARVTDDRGKDLYFVQEKLKEDGSFYVILSDPAETGRQYSITAQYEGDKVLEQAGDGGFFLGARSSGDPTLNGFGEHVLFNLTYKVPLKYTVIDVG